MTDELRRLESYRTFHVAFLRPKTFFQRLIARFDRRGDFCHAELVFPYGGITFAIHAWAGCRFLYDQTYRSADWELVPVQLDAGRAYAACRMIAGDRYDYLGVLRFVFKQLRPSIGRWFCSEGTGAIISVSGGPCLRRPYLIGPKELYAVLKRFNRMQEEKER